MGSKVSRDNIEEDVPTTTSTTVEQPAAPPPKENTQQEFFEHLHEKLSQTSASLKSGTLAPLPVSKVIDFFQPPTKNYEGQNINLAAQPIRDFWFKFPSQQNASTDFKVCGMEIGAISTTPLKPLSLSGSSQGPFQIFNVKLLIEGPKLSYGLKEFPGAQNLLFQLRSLSFDMVIDTAPSNYRIYRLKATPLSVDGDVLIVKKEGESETVVVNSIPMQAAERIDLHPLPEVTYTDTLPASQFSDYVISRFSDLDAKKFEKLRLFTCQEETVQIRIRLNCISCHDRKWVMISRSCSLEVIGEQVFMTLNGEQYAVSAHVPGRSCTFLGRRTEPEAQMIAVKLTPSTTDCTLEISKPLNKNHYSKTIKPFVAQELDIQPPKQFGKWSTLSVKPANPNQRTSFGNIEVPAFFARMCSVILRQSYTIKESLERDEAVSEQPALFIHTGTKIPFLYMAASSMNPGTPSKFEFRIRFDGGILVFFEDTISTETWQKPVKSTSLRPLRNLNFGEFVLLKCSRIWESKNEIPTEKLSKLHDYEIKSVSSTLDFVSQVFEIELTLSQTPKAQQASPNSDPVATCIVTLNFERMTATIVEKRVFGIELEFIMGIPDTDLRSLLGQAFAATISPYNDITVVL